MSRRSALARRRLAGNGIAAVVAQCSQAAGSLLLQIVAARALGISGLGQFGLLYGILVLATAISSGFVGDSLTVLDRQRALIRAALQNWLILLSVLSAVLCALGVWVTEFVTGRDALAFGVATMVFLVEDAVRRLLMANLRFWSIVAMDTISLVVMAALVLGVPAITLAWLFVALAVGQGFAAGVGVWLLPRTDRWLAGRPLPAAHRQVFEYGAFRALQQAVRPTMLALTRVVVIAAVGVAASGELEAARIYTAPAMLVVFGLNSFLFASFAIDQTQHLAAARRRADRGVLLLVAITLAFGIVAALAIPIFGPMIAGRHYEIPLILVVGWIAYAVSVATVTPYGALAAVRGLQKRVLAIRAADSMLSLGLAALLSYLIGSADWVPCGLAVGSFAGGIALRWFVLRPRTNA
jgi:O-antigen/teichoic acid export membrane protein